MRAKYSLLTSSLVVKLMVLGTAWMVLMPIHSIKKSPIGRQGQIDLNAASEKKMRRQIGETEGNKKERSDGKKERGGILKEDEGKQKTLTFVEAYSDRSRRIREDSYSSPTQVSRTEVSKCHSQTTQYFTVFLWIIIQDCADRNSEKERKAKLREAETR